MQRRPIAPGAGLQHCLAAWRPPWIRGLRGPRGLRWPPALGNSARAGRPCCQPARRANFLGRVGIRRHAVACSRWPLTAPRPGRDRPAMPTRTAHERAHGTEHAGVSLPNPYGRTGVQRSAGLDSASSIADRPYRVTIALPAARHKKPSGQPGECWGANRPKPYCVFSELLALGRGSPPAGAGVRPGTRRRRAFAAPAREHDGLRFPAERALARESRDRSGGNAERRPLAIGVSPSGFKLLFRR